MGSANTSCGISGIDMGYNTEAGIVLLLPNENPDTYGTVNLDPTNYYKPFLPPIFGTYTDDAFTITQETPITRYLENLFHIPINDILSALSRDNNSVYSYYSSPLPEMLGGPKINKRNWSFEDLGFTRDGNKYIYGDYSIEIAEHFMTISCVGMKEPLDIVRYGTISPGTLYIDTFVRVTEVFPGYDKKYWEGLRLFMNLRGMVFRKDMFDKFTTIVEKYPEFPNLYDTKKMRTLFVKNPPLMSDEDADLIQAEMDKIIDSGKSKQEAFELTDDLRAEIIARNSMNRVERSYDLRRMTSLPRNIDTLWETEDGMDQESDNLAHLMHIMNSMNRQFLPTFLGRQYGNSEAMIKMARFISDILPSLTGEASL